MKNFEDIARDRILDATLRDIPPELHLDKNDVEIFAGMIYALLRAGARREGQKGFAEAFSHFAQGADGRPSSWAYSSDEELELIRGALLAAVDRFSLEARALHVYFDALEHNGASEEESTRLAMDALQAL
ncbi:MAG TPA: hypothetical protein VG537_10405 [Candidatus Kapabacteria bacterium]|jgi:hypothetical protein|nr:hypothetical protein [Candidatus Kapabacteria bacterium]